MFRRAQVHKFGRFSVFIAEILQFWLLFDNQKLFNLLLPTKKWHFQSDFVISLSRVSRPYLFNDPSKKHVAIMESWDHPVKAPWFLFPRFTFTWNKQLGNDIAKFQGISRVRRISPLKFSYIQRKPKYHLPNELEAGLQKHYQQDIDDLAGLKQPVIIYAMAFSEKNMDAFKGELKFVRQLVDACIGLDYHLFVKPKPLSKGTMLGEYFSKDTNVLVGREPYCDDGVDLLSANYISYRKSILHRSLLVLDCGSTFLFDAALHNTPVVKIDIVNGGFQVTLTLLFLIHIYVTLKIFRLDFTEKKTS